MDSLDQITRAEAEELADQFLRLFSLFNSLLRPGEDPQRALRLAQQALEKPEDLRRDLITAIMSGDMKFDDFVTDKATLTKLLASPRRILDEIKKEFPPGQPGRPAKEVDEDQLAQLATRLLPMCRALLALRSHPTKQSVAASIEYLSPDFPKAAKFLSERVSRVEAILANRDLLKAIRSMEGRARALAYVIAGEEAGYHGTYALRKVRTAIDRRKRARDTKP